RRARAPPRRKSRPNTAGFCRPVSPSSPAAYRPASPIRARTSRGRRATSRPATVARPASSRSRVDRMRTAVVLPAPFGPSRPCTVPVRTARPKPSRARWPPERFSRARACTACSSFMVPLPKTGYTVLDNAYAVLGFFGAPRLLPMTSSAGDTRSSGGGDLARTLDLLWNTDRRPSRGPKPGLTLERIVDAAGEVADRDGPAALSRRRIATELGTGTMPLYRYVPGKAELLDLMLDRVQRPEDDAAPGPGRAPSAAPDALPDAPASPGDGGWQAALEEHARATLARYHR